MTDQTPDSDVQDSDIHAPATCPNCGANDFERGKLGGEVYFAPDTEDSVMATKSWKRVSVIRCRNCGRLEMYAAPKKKKV